MSYGRFNPNDPFLIGPEWPATTTQADPIDPAREIAQRVHMTANATAAHLHFHSPSPQPGGSDAAFTNWILATVYEEGQERNYGVNRSFTVGVGGGSTNGAFIGGAVSVADALGSPVDGKGIRLDPGEFINLNCQAPTFLLTQPRILDVTFQTLASSTIDQSGLSLNYRLASGSVIPLGGHNLGLKATTNRLSTGEVFLGGYDDSITPTEARRRVWRISDVNDLTAGTVQLRLTNSSLSIMDVTWVDFTIDYCQENRLASGGLIRSSLPQYPWVPGWQSTVDLADPLTGLAPVLLAGRDYIVSLTQATNRRVTNFNTQVVPPVLPRQDGASRDLSSLRPTDDSPIRCAAYPRLDDGRIGGPGVPLNRGYAVVLTNPALVSIGDLSQPYAQIATAAPLATLQEVFSSTGGQYDMVRVTVRKIGNPPDLIVTVGASVAALTVAAYDSLEADEQGFVTATARFNTPVSMTAGSEVTINANTLIAADHWEVPILNTTSVDPTYNSVTYGGTNQAAVFPGLDVPMLLQMAVPTVTGLGVTHQTQTLSPTVTGCPTPTAQIVGLDYAEICWGAIPIVSGSPGVTGMPPMVSGAPIVSGFCAWDVERRDDDDPVWRRIAHITDYAIRCVSDFEARFSVSTDYRVRLCRIDGACGDWAPVTGFVRAAPPGCDGLIFTSNENPIATLAYPYAFDGTPVEEFEFVEAETLVLQRLHMRDYQVAFRPLERGGVRFSRTMLINATSVPPRLLDEGFRDLRDLAWASLSYVAVLDTRGNRWFAAVNVPAGTVRQSMQIYLAAVDIVEVTDRPSVIDVEAF